MTDFPCRDLESKCSFRVIDLSENNAFCRFYKEYWKTYDISPIYASNLTKKACEDIRQYELYREHLTDVTEKRTIDMLKKVKVGDSLSWVTYGEDVILIEKPSELKSSIDCTCQRQNKEIIKIPADLLRQISKGNYFQEYFIHDINKAREALILELTARGAGFRVKIKKQKDGFKFKFFGDSQEEVDDFVSIVANNDFDLF